LKTFETSCSRRITVLILTVCCVLVPTLRLAAQDPQGKYSEEKVKAALLLHFSRYTEWPRGTRPRNQAPLVIGVVNSPKVAADLQRLIGVGAESGPAAGEGRIPEFQVVEVSVEEETEKCQVVYFGHHDQASRVLLDQLSKKAVLTVGEGRQFTAEGGVIGFAHQRRKIGYYFSVEAMGKCGIRMAPNIIGSAIKPEEKEDGE